ncbi:MAG: hypothetical protein JXA96_08780 [Sedimentisphaerales bacterium]|nr:hypothetical protein [Sedimentisphaerales bacterium]
MAKKAKSDSKESKVSGKPSSLIDTRVIYSNDILSKIQSFFKKTSKTISNYIDQNETQYARIIIPSSWKHEILERLRNMSIYSKSLDYPGADLVGLSLTNALKQSFRK